VQAYLERGRSAGTLTLTGPAPLTARTIVELCALWAVHLHFDPAPPAADIDETTVTAMVADFVARATRPTSRHQTLH